MKNQIAYAMNNIEGNFYIKNLISPNSQYNNKEIFESKKTNIIGLHLQRLFWNYVRFVLMSKIVLKEKRKIIHDEKDYKNKIYERKYRKC